MPQRGIGVQPKVAPSSGLPWVSVHGLDQRQRRCGQAETTLTATTALRLGIRRHGHPWVARASQPRALSRNPLGIHRTESRSVLKNALRNAMNIEAPLPNPPLDQAWTKGGDQTFQLRIPNAPTGHRPPAQGCPVLGATLGLSPRIESTPTALWPSRNYPDGRNRVAVGNTAPRASQGSSCLATQGFERNPLGIHQGEYRRPPSLLYRRCPNLRRGAQLKASRWKSYDTQVETPALRPPWLNHNYTN